MLMSVITYLVLYKASYILKTGLRTSLLCSDRTFVQAWICTDDTWASWLQTKGWRCYLSQKIGPAVGSWSSDSIYDLRTIFQAVVFCGMEHVTWDVLISYIDIVCICTSQLTCYKSQSWLTIIDVLITSIMCASWVATSHRGGALSSAK